MLPKVRTKLGRTSEISSSRVSLHVLAKAMSGSPAQRYVFVSQARFTPACTSASLSKTPDGPMNGCPWNSSVIPGLMPMTMQEGPDHSGSAVHHSPETRLPGAAGQPSHAVANGTSPPSYRGLKPHVLRVRNPLQVCRSDARAVLTLVVRLQRKGQPLPRDQLPGKAMCTDAALPVPVPDTEHPVAFVSERAGPLPAFIAHIDLAPELFDQGQPGLSSSMMWLRSISCSRTPGSGSLRSARGLLVRHTAPR